MHWSRGNCCGKTLNRNKRKMEATICLNIADCPVGIGGIVDLRSLPVRPKQTVGMPNDTPVLACPLAPTDAHLLSNSNGRANFALGSSHEKTAF